MFVKMSKLKIIRIVSFIILFCGLAAAEEKKHGQQTQSQPQTTPTVTYEILQQGTYSGIKEAVAKVITTEKEWQELWKKHVSMLVPQPPLPEVDFQTYNLAVIFSGEKRTSGYQIILKQIVPEANDVVVHYHETEPPANSFTLQVFTQPYLILKIPKPKGSIKLLKE
jgi:hypothetical protein